MTIFAETTVELPTVTIISTVTTSHWLASCLALLLSVVLIYLLRKSLGTTLFAPCVWALISIASIALVTLSNSSSENSEFSIGLSALHFAAAAGTLCPLMAILGAKRPQNRGWQWVVLSLWLVVVWPAVQAMLIPAGRNIELFIAWKLFLVGLIAVGLLNYLPTRNWLSACFIVTGQFVLLDSFLWKWELVDPQWTMPVGLGCFLAAATVLCLRRSATHAISEKQESFELKQFDRRWLSFRDAFGTLWALRILGRINQTAELSDWPMRLEWAGFFLEEEPTAKQLGELEQAMSTLLRRFV